MTQITSEMDGLVQIIRFNRPEKMNALTKDMYADHFIAFHMAHMPTYNEATALARSASPDKKAAADATVETVFKGNMLRGTLLTAYAFGTLGVLAGYGAIAALIGALLMLVLTIAGVIHLRRTPDEAMI